MSAYGISGFVDGFMRGRDFRNAQEDRKEAKARQKRMDDLLFTQDARSAEEHAKRMGAMDRRAAEEERLLADEAAQRETLKRAYDATQESMGAAPDEAPQPALDPQPASAGVAIPLTPPPNRTTEAFTGRGGMGLPSGGGSGSGGDNSSPEPAQDARTLGAVARNDGYRVVPAPSAAIADELYMQGPAGVRYVQVPNGSANNSDTDPVRKIPGPNYDHSFLQSGGLLSDAGELASRFNNLSDKAETGIVDRLASDASRLVNPVTDYVAGVTFPVRDGGPNKFFPRGVMAGPYGGGWATGEQSVSGAGPASALDTAKEVGGSSKAKSIKDLAAAYDASTQKPAMQATPETKDLPGPTRQRAEMMGFASDAMADSATPAISAAAASAKTENPEAMGLKPGERVTEKQRTKAADSFIEHYMEVGAPIVIEDMIRRGDYKGATEFQTWMDTQGARAGMKSWARAAFAASVGDMDSFADEVVNAYNRMDYFPDGTTIVKDESGFTYGKGGEITGAKLTFKDEESGNTFEQVFSDPNDLVRLGITLLAPEQAFTHYAEQVNTKSQSGLTEKDLLELQDKRDKRVDDIAKSIFEAGKDAALNGGEPITYEEARKQAEIAVSGGSLGALDGSSSAPPIMRRPVN